MSIRTNTIPLLIMSLVLLSAPGCMIPIADFTSGKLIRGNGIVVTEERSIEDFDSIEVHGAIQLELTCQAEPSLSIKAEENLLPIIETNCRDGLLVIRSTEAYKSTKPIIVKTSCSKLVRYQGVGATEGKVDNVESESLQVELSGACSLVIQKGKVNSLKASVSGASSMNAGNVEASNAIVTTSGASKAIVKVSEELTAKADGVSGVVNKAHAKVVKKRISSMAYVQQAK